MEPHSRENQQRIAKRQRVLKQGKIVFLNNLSVVDCMIRDLSESGAKLICDDQMAAPNEFRLVVLMDKTIRDAQVAWRRGNMLGVIFTGEAKPAPPRKW